MFRSPRAQRIGDRAAHTLVIYDENLAAMLSGAGIPTSVYSTSEDGYLLEAFVSRRAKLRNEVTVPLARKLAQYFHRKYPRDDETLNESYSRGNYTDYLVGLYNAERSE